MINRVVRIEQKKAVEREEGEWERQIEAMQEPGIMANMSVILPRRELKTLVELKTGQTNHLVTLRAIIKVTIFRESPEPEYN